MDFWTSSVHVTSLFVIVHACRSTVAYSHKQQQGEVAVATQVLLRCSSTLLLFHLKCFISTTSCSLGVSSWLDKCSQHQRQKRLLSLEKQTTGFCALVSKQLRYARTFERVEKKIELCPVVKLSPRRPLSRWRQTGVKRTAMPYYVKGVQKTKGIAAFSEVFQFETFRRGSLEW